MGLASAYRVPNNSASFKDTMRSLLTYEFPAILDKSVEMFEVVPKTGIYRHFRPDIVPFDTALHEQLSRQHTISGVGSLFDFKQYGHEIRRPTPQAAGGNCGGTSLCLEPTCFGFSEGVRENNNHMRDMCWSMALTCLKDMWYSDANFPRTVKSYFSVFFKQPMAVIQAFQRTKLIADSIKILATNKNIRYTGSELGGTTGISLPFYINPVDSISFPNLNNLPAGVSMGGVNLQALATMLLPRLFAGGMSGGVRGYKVYGLEEDFTVAKLQTQSVQDNGLALETLMVLSSQGIKPPGVGKMDQNFVEDPLFPTFEPDADGNLLPVPAEILEPATLYGVEQTSNPAHRASIRRGLLLVPDNYWFALVEPPKDDFSDLGLGQALDFRTQTPGVTPIMSSQSFLNNTMGSSRKVLLGQTINDAGLPETSMMGLEPRQRQIAEAVRTDLMLLYTEPNVDAPAGQYPTVGRKFVRQKRADGFELKSVMYVKDEIEGDAKPVLVLFMTDIPRGARAIEVCTGNLVEIDVSVTEPDMVVGCSPGGQTFAVITMSSSQVSKYSVGNKAIYREGINGATHFVSVTAVAGNTVTISDDNNKVISCCDGPADTYGAFGTLEKVTGVTNKTSEIFKAFYDEGTSRLIIETLHPVAASSTGADGTITLEDGTTIEVTTAANATGVVLQLVADTGELCDISTLTCGCLARATITMD